MGLTKQYLRYSPLNIFGIVASTRCNPKLLRSFKGTNGKFVAVGACEYVFVWDLKKGETVLKLATDDQNKSKTNMLEVTCIEQNPKYPNRLAVGYLDGSLRLFDLSSTPDASNQQLASYLTFNGHKSAVTSINFDSNGVRMVSGSKDTDLVLWDLVGECGLFRLKGHKSPINKAIFMNNYNILISCAKDMLVKFWDLETRHCFKTLVNHRSEVNDLLLVKNERRLITGCHDNELRVFELNYLREEKEVNGDDDVTARKKNNCSNEPSEKKMKGLRVKKIKADDDESDDEDAEEEDDNNDDDNDEDEEKADDDYNQLLECKLIGSLIRESKDPLSQLCVDSTQTIFSSHSSNEKHVEFYKINTPEEIKKRLSKKIKKQKRKLASNSQLNGEEVSSDAIEQQIAIEQTVNDEFTKIAQLKSKHKVKYVDLMCEFDSKSKSQQSQSDDEGAAESTTTTSLFHCKVVCLLNNNQLEIYDLNVTKQINEIKDPQLLYTLATPAHRTDVRTIAFSASNDSSSFVTASGDSMKVWNRISLKCIRTFECGDYILTSMYLSDENHVLLGSKTGKIHLYNINTATLLELVQAHKEDTALWSLCMSPDKSGFVSGGADKSVKFWQFELVDDEINKTKKRLSFNHLKSLQLDDDVLCVKITPNGKYVAVALLDTTVKVFFIDSLKLFLNLYGHKQPVLTMDISFDNRLIVTGSADRHIKIWGLDFGDCHRSIFAHEDSIMSVQFVGKTHYLFSVGKDGKLKEWDVDKFERIITLNGHLNEIWSMGVSGDGKYVVTGSHDKSLRIWEKTNEPLVLEDERETEKEEQYEKELPKEEFVIAGESNRETGLATIKTIETIKAAEKMIESLNVYNEELEKQNAYEYARSLCKTKEEKDKIKMDPKNPILIAVGDISAEEFVLDRLKKTKSSEIETMLLVLEFEHAKELLELLCNFIKRNMEVELCVRCAIFLLKVNYGQITTTQTLLPLVEQLRSLCFSRVKTLQDSIGYNLAAVKYLKQQLDESEQVRLFSDLTLKKSKINKSNKVTLVTLKSASSVST